MPVVKGMKNVDIIIRVIDAVSDTTIGYNVTNIHLKTMLSADNFVLPLIIAMFIQKQADDTYYYSALLRGH